MATPRKQKETAPNPNALPHDPTKTNAPRFADETAFWNEAVVLGEALAVAQGNSDEAIALRDKAAADIWFAYVDGVVQGVIVDSSDNAKKWLAAADVKKTKAAGTIGTQASELRALVAARNAGLDLAATRAVFEDKSLSKAEKGDKSALRAIVKVSQEVKNNPTKALPVGKESLVAIANAKAAPKAKTPETPVVQLTPEQVALNQKVEAERMLRTSAETILKLEPALDAKLRKHIEAIIAAFTAPAAPVAKAA